MISDKAAKDAAARCVNLQNAKLQEYYDDEMTLYHWSLQELARREWQDEPSGDGWYWCEELDADSPPQKIAQHLLGIDANGDDIQPTWKRWTIAGWVSLTGRVCKITERPA